MSVKGEKLVVFRINNSKSICKIESVLLDLYDCINFFMFLIAIFVRLKDNQ